MESEARVGNFHDVPGVSVLDAGLAIIFASADLIPHPGLLFPPQLGAGIDHGALVPLNRLGQGRISGCRIIWDIRSSVKRTLRPR